MGALSKKSQKEKSQLKERTKRQRLGAAMFLAPSLIGVFLFFVLPFFVVIFYSFVDNPISKEFVWFENYVNVLGNGAFKQAGQNTLKFSFIAMPLSVILGLLLAILLDRNIPLRSQFRTAFLTPMMVPVASVVLIVQVIFHYNGALNQVITSLGGTQIDWMKSDHAQIVIVFLFLWKNLGYNMILFLAALESVPKDVIEVALLDSANPFQIFFKIKIRYLTSTILFVTILSLINSFKVFREIYLLTGDHPVPSLYMLQHYMNNMFASLDYQKLSTAAIIMSIVMVIIIGILFLVENYFGKDVEE